MEERIGGGGGGRWADYIRYMYYDLILEHVSFAIRRFLILYRHGTYCKMKKSAMILPKELKLSHK